ncbi:MAG: histidine kinase [Bacteroidales bacterium]|nr:histidine kinase [Bacteroidales bacterium]
MINPLFGKRNYYILYTGIWIIVAGVHLFVLTYEHVIDLEIAITESIVANFIIAFLGLSLWYPVFYLHYKHTNVFVSILQLMILSVVANIIWFAITFLILGTTFSHNEAYNHYLFQSIPWKLAMGLLYYFLIVLFYNFIIYYQNFKDKVESESELKALIKESELKSLKSQINPHFLFNSLNSISSLTIISPEKARDMIIKLSEFLRYSLSSNERNLTSLEKEVNNVNRYLDIEKVRFGNRLNIVKNIDEECYTKSLPWLILQPLIENSIKYGVYENIDNSTIELNARCTQDALKLEIINNYDEELIINKGEGIGLQNIRRRLKLIYNKENLIQIFNNQGIFKIVLTFPQNELNLK